MWALIFGGLSGDDEESGDSLLGSLLLLLVAPLAATLIQLGISRAREFQADAGGARILGDPLPLASGLEKLEWATRRVPMAANPAVAALYIVNPLRGAGVLWLFRTHPPTEDRIARLRALARHARYGSAAARYAWGVAHIRGRGARPFAPASAQSPLGGVVRRRPS